MAETHTRETLGFQAEVRQLLKLMIHSLYSNKEIVLRELISNASDAADKLRFEALTDKALYESDPDLKIRVAFDPKARTITVSDNGIGMSRQDVIENIGTIAKSGTREFFEKLTGDEARDELLIGFTLRSIIRKYSDHIALPILMKKEEWQKDEKADKGEKPSVSEEDE